ncbi:MAG TPA: hypothetical protein VD883_00880 [Candidatus Omnitrophota bacterium]|nr:hypothetical protein [Candidatus Omnitrophota bacterium]
MWRFKAMKIVRALFLILPIFFGGVAVHAMELAPCASLPVMTASAMNCCGVGCDCSMEVPAAPLEAVPGRTQAEPLSSPKNFHELPGARWLDTLPEVSGRGVPSDEPEESPHQSSSVKLYDLIGDYRK